MSFTRIFEDVSDTLDEARQPYQNRALLAAVQSLVEKHATNLQSLSAGLQEMIGQGLLPRQDSKLNEAIKHVNDAQTALFEVFETHKKGDM